MSDPLPSPPPSDTGPDAIRRAFVPVANSTDTPAPDDGVRVLPVNTEQPISSLARTVGMICHAAPIFRLGENLVTVNESGQIAPMNSERFTTWIELYLSFSRPGKNYCSIGKDVAAKIMASDQFRDHIRELKSVSAVRVPVFREDGEKKTLELSPIGYDDATGLFTVNGIPYQEDMSAEEAWDFLGGVYHEFAFDPEGEAKVSKRRSYAAQMAAAFGVYCHALFPHGTPRPMITYIANQAGSGKSLLMRLALCPVHGQVPECDKPDDEKALQTLLESAALQYAPFLVLDNCYNLRSKSLDRFISSPVHSPRLFNKQETRAVMNCTQVFANGNNLTLTPDLERRSLVVDLRVFEEAASRTFKWEITEEWYPRPEIRAKFLAALWALVRRWRDSGMPRMAEHRRASFETWSRLIGGIVISCGMANPFTPRSGENGGNEEGRALTLVFVKLADQALGCDRTLKTGDIIAEAESSELLELIVPPEKNAEKSLGWAIKRLGLPRHFLDSHGRAFEIKKKELSEGAGYIIRFL